MRLRSSRTSSGSHVSRFHTLFTLWLMPLCLGSSSLYLYSVLSSSSRTFWQASTISLRSFFCWSLSSRSERTISTSWRIIERPRTLSSPKVSSDELYAQETYSSEISLNCFGAPTKSFRILLASSIAAIKSPTLKPKLIVNVKHSSVNSTREARLRGIGTRENRERKKTALIAFRASSTLSLTRRSLGRLGLDALATSSCIGTLISHTLVNYFGLYMSRRDRR